jgi:hypothetical protein
VCAPCPVGMLLCVSSHDAGTSASTRLTLRANGLYCAAVTAVPKHLEVVELSRINQARKVVLKQIHYLTSKGVAAA